MTESKDPLLTVSGLGVDFASRRGRKRVTVRAVRDVSLHICREETLAVVGESGSGKSTLARAVLRLLPNSGGTVVLDATDLTACKGHALRAQRRNMQMVFQDPYSSLDPSSTILGIVGEPLQEHFRLRGAILRERVCELLEAVGLDRAVVDRYIHEFSGGQRQRLAIARAIAVDPSLVVLDEAVSALDVSTQNQILELLIRLQREKGLSYLFISHNLGVVRWIADRTAVMYLGEIVEEGPAGRVHEAPAHPYTRSLLASMPVPDPARQRARERAVLRGETPDPAAELKGCPFRGRCPVEIDICADVKPDLRPVAGGGSAACHLLPSIGGHDEPSLIASNEGTSRHEG
ncbi:MAG: ABC transporter ATP-binding protein [Cumulibacter sp.]